MMKDRQSEGVGVGVHQKSGGPETLFCIIFGMVSCEALNICIARRDVSIMDGYQNQ